MKHLRLPYEYNADLVSDHSGLACEDKSLTHQSFAEECDINTIIDRFGISGELPQNLNYVDNQNFVEVFDFHTAMNQIVEAEKSFLALPARVRSRFENDPGQYVAFCSDPNNIQEMVELGLAVKLAPQAQETVSEKVE
ncbi:MAG: internal scaffolding protein [Microvirus sp.]|nr:MAG: internal scaffolding protein [Microvirus sp.]